MTLLGIKERVSGKSRRWKVTQVTMGIPRCNMLERNGREGMKEALDLILLDTIMLQRYGRGKMS